MLTIIVFYPDHTEEGTPMWSGQFFGLDHRHEVRPTFLDAVGAGAKFAIVGTEDKVYGLKMDGDDMITAELSPDHEFYIYGKIGHLKRQEVVQKHLC